jgi:hypothetical protein
MDTGQSWFYQTTSDLIFEDDVSNQVGIGLNNSNPNYDLDVKDTIGTSNLVATGLIQSSNILNTGQIETLTLMTDDLSASNITTPLVMASNVISSIIGTGLIEAQDVDTQHINLYDPAFSSNNNHQGLIHINGYDLSQPFPDSDGLINSIDWWFNEERKNAPIHPSWIQDD